MAEELGVEFAFPTQTVHIDSFSRDTPREVGRKRSEEELAETVAAFGPRGRLSRPNGPELRFEGDTLDYTPRAAPSRGSE